MPRRKPASAKQRKAQLQDRRALKRGDIDQLPVKPKASRRAATSSTNAEPSSRRLQSRFISVTPAYLVLTRDLAHNVPLLRPIPASSAVFPIEILTGRDQEGKLTCPARPRFRFEQSKKEVEMNEEGMFKKWLVGAEGVMKAWVEGKDEEEAKDPVAEGEEDSEEGDQKWPRSPSWFETNLEVWRQLWRVTESSSIILVLLDSRCPPLHAPPSLRTYIQALKPRKEIILVLTKADLVDPEAVKGWKQWIVEWWGGDAVQVVSVMSYDLELLHSSKAKHKPAIPEGSMDELIAALQNAHQRLLEPPQRIKDDAKRLTNWRPPVRRSVDWSLLAHHDVRYSQNETICEISATANPGSENGGVQRNPQFEPLTIGLVGQPNVGKSSLLNALLGEQRVRASRTPGKTKHFQTMFWGWKKEVKIVDCPGLVCPSLVGLELQALAGILPIAQIPSLPACIHYAATLLPIETIFHVPQSSSAKGDAYADKRTWRDPVRAQAVLAEKAKEVKWTAGGIMEARALDRGYLTAKSGRPDGNRAANFIMRALADGRVRWGFWRSGMGLDREGVGIWLEGTGTEHEMEDGKDEESEVETAETVSERGEEHVSDDLEDEEAEESDEDVKEVGTEDGKGQAGKGKAGGFFAALDMNSDEEVSGTDEEDEAGLKKEDVEDLRREDEEDSRKKGEEKMRKKDEQVLRKEDEQD